MNTRSTNHHPWFCISRFIHGQSVTHRRPIILYLFASINCLSIAWCPFDRYDRYDRCDRSKAVNLCDRWAIAESCPFDRSSRSKNFQDHILLARNQNQHEMNLYSSAPWEIWRSLWSFTIAGVCPYDRCARYDRYDRWGERWNRTWSYSSDRNRCNRYNRCDRQQWCVHLVAAIAGTFFQRSQRS